VRQADVCALKIKDDGILTTNFFTRSINGKYILDSSDLSIPPTLLPLLVVLPFKNLRLHTTSGSVTAEVWIRHDGSLSMNSKRVPWELGSNSGSVRAIVVRFSLDYTSVVPYFNG
jgi:hypothetical protein